MTGNLNQNAPDLLWQSLRQSVAQPTVWLDLARSYASRGLPWQAGYAARQALRLDAGLEAQLQALDIGPWHDTSAGDALLGRTTLPEAAALAERFSAVVNECSGDWLTWLYLARLQEMQAAPDSQPESGQSGQDVSSSDYALQQAGTFEPVPGESLHWLGVWRLNAGDAQGAVPPLAALLDVRPVRYGSMMYLGEALLLTGNTAAAEKAFARASLSDNPDFLLTLSARVYAHNYWQEAIDVLQKALTVKPDSVPLLLALAKIQSEVNRLDDCRESLSRVLALEPDNPEARLIDAGITQTVI